MARSFTVSVFPVPAGPAGDPPSRIDSACVSVMMHRSVSGVMTSRPFSPMYSYPYRNSPVHCRTRRSSTSRSQ